MSTPSSSPSPSSSSSSPAAATTREQQHEHEIFPYSPPRALAANLWQIEGTLKFPVPRNMTIWRAPHGALVLYSVIAMHDDGLRALEALGTPAIMVVPHRRHHMDVSFYKARYPGLRVLAEDPTPVRGVAIDGSVKELETLGVHAGRIPGTSYEDIALDLPIAGGRALCVCELLSNMSSGRGFFKLVMRLIGPRGGFGVSPIVRVREVRARSLTKAWLTRQSRRQDLRMVLVGHGAPVMADVAAALIRAAGQV